jgi:hypothetical protein
MPVAQDWHSEAIDLRRQGLSERMIAEAVGKAASTVHEVVKDIEPDSNGDVPAVTPGQQTIDGDEVPAETPVTPVIEEVRVDGTTQLGLIDFGGKRPQSATVTLTGGQFELEHGTAFRKGDDILFAGRARVTAVGGHDVLDTKTMIATTAVQKHIARIHGLHTGDEEQVLIGLFRELVASNRMLAVKVADALVREANGG